MLHVMQISENISNRMQIDCLIYDERGRDMTVSYKKLWKRLIDMDMRKKDLVETAGISTYTVNKLNRGENVTTDVLVKICKALNCTFDDIMEVVD